MDHLEPLDLAPLRPDEAARERMARAILARAAPALAHRIPARGPLLLLAGWARPLLAAAAVVAAVSLTAMAMLAPQEPIRLETMAERPEIADPMDAWMVEPREPTELDLLRALEGDTP